MARCGNLVTHFRPKAEANSANGILPNCPGTASRVNHLDDDPLEYFNRWLTQPITPTSGRSVLSIVDALNRHPLAQDEAAQDYVMPAARYRERPGRFRVFGENQDTWYCFVYEGEELTMDPPVYFETCLDLRLDHGYSDRQIIGGDHVEVCPRFTDFLWFLLGRYFCIRLERASFFAAGVHGITTKGRIALDDSFVNPLGREFPAGYTGFLGPETICVPDWGAAFLNVESGRRFLERASPVINRHWG